MNREELHSIYRAHAAARLRGDAAGARRLLDEIPEGQRMTHYMFVMSLFAQVLIDHWGASPDPDDLAGLTKRLHDKHFSADSGFNAIRAEALVRALDGESVFLTEIPHAEQTGYMWAVMRELVDPNSSDAALAARFAEAEELRTTWLSEAFADPYLKPSEPGPEAAGSEVVAPDPAEPGIPEPVVPETAEAESPELESAASTVPATSASEGEETHDS